MAPEMRRFTGTEKGGIACASLFVIGGLLMIVHPIDMGVVRSGLGRYGTGSLPPEHVSKEMTREIGGAVVLAGVGFACFVLYRCRE